MRMFMLPMILICSLLSAAKEASQELGAVLKGFDYGSLLITSSRIMEKYSDQIRTILITGDEEARLEVKSDEESFELMIAMSCFLLAFIRMKQEIACLEDAEHAHQELNMLWEQAQPIFVFIPEDLQESAKRFVAELLVVCEDREAEWMPREQSGLCYVAPTEWTAIRQAVARELSWRLCEA